MITLGQPLQPDPAVFTALLDEIVLSDRWSNGGPVVHELERQLRTDLGWSHVASAASGTAALTLALLACDLKPGAEVITSSLTFAATPLAIEAAGLVPVFAASDPVTLTLDPTAVAKAIGPQTGAILPVHLFGLAASPDLDHLGLPVIYDGAHAFGLADITGRGTATAYSLHATKLLHTGEGGAVGTDDPAIAARIVQARNFGLVGDRLSGRGLNGKLSELSAALGLAVRARLDEEVRERQHVREAYRRIVERSARVQPHAPGRSRALVMEVVRCSARDQEALMTDLASVGVIARRFPALCGAGQRYQAEPVIGSTAADQAALADTLIALPMHGRVSDADLAAIAAVLA